LEELPSGRLSYRLRRRSQADLVPPVH